VITSFKQLLSLTKYQHVNKSAVGKGWLMLGGSTQLQKGPTYYAGDLSGIQQKNIPFWFQGLGLYKPGKKIAKQKDWGKKLEEIVANAPNWDIGFIVGVPAWLQLCMEKIIERYKLNNIHEIWPNLSFYVHGGVSFQPYKKGFGKLLGKPLIYIETYLASEGFIAYQDRPNADGMRLVTNEHIFHEFIPFDDMNFDDNGDPVTNHQILTVADVKENKEYAILISTSAGAWRYLIGDTIRFTNKERCEIVITGRTKHYLNVVGEQLSVQKMNMAIQKLEEVFNIEVKEYVASTIFENEEFIMKWMIGSNTEIEPQKAAEVIDTELCDNNKNYKVARSKALKGVQVEIIPVDAERLGRGVAFFSSRQDKNWSLADCVSFLVMNDRGLNDAATSDEHFEQAGFVALLRTPSPAV
jgi:hypothetical protein